MYQPFAFPGDQSPAIPKIGPLFNSQLFQRRAQSQEFLQENDYDEIVDYVRDLSTGEMQVEKSVTFQKVSERYKQLYFSWNIELTKCCFNFINEYLLSSVESVFIFRRVTANMSFDNMLCSRCGEGFEPQEKIVNSTGELWHQQCFV